VIVTVDAEEIRETSPPVEVRVAPVMFEIAPVPESVMSPAAFTLPDTVVLPAELDISTTPREVIGAALVIVDALEILTVAALIAPVPVVTVEDAPVLEMVTPCAAVMVGELVVV
jgi:hypothetical protein